VAENDSEKRGMSHVDDSRKYLDGVSKHQWHRKNINGVK